MLLVRGKLQCFKKKSFWFLKCYATCVLAKRNWSRTLTERSGGNGAVAVFMACYDCFFVQSMPRASKQQARYAVGR
ncbi:hypothetical protein ACVGX7_00210, partial [Enterobacter hormaechei]